MTEESSTTSHLSAAMTTTGMMQITGGNTVTPLSSLGIEFYFQCAVLVIGVVGIATNGLVLYALVASKQHKKHVLIVNQNALDLFSSFMMVVIYSFKLCNIYLTGSVGYLLCTLILSENLFWCGSLGSVINLASITIERYVKVVHSAWSKKKLREWVIYSAAAFAWISSFIYNFAVVFSTTVVVDGACYPYAVWASDMANKIQLIWFSVSFYVVPLLIFIFCYWRILVVIRRQARLMAGHDVAGPSTAQTPAQAQSNQIQFSVIQTMILICVLYAVSWLPSYAYVLNLSLNQKPIDDGYYAALIMVFLYVCTNPFIYATKFDPVKEVLLRLIQCKKNSG